jgi:AcrR family transcriptional regulator
MARILFTGMQLQWNRNLMASRSSGKRVYNTERRDEQARQTRARILDAARELLIAEGFFAMTVPLLAQRAEVSPQTVYNSVGGKAEVVKAVYDVLLAGDDDPTPMKERPEVRALHEAPDWAAFSRAYAARSRGILDRVGPLLGVILAHGPGGDQVLQEFLATIENERRIGNAIGLKGLRDRGALPQSRSADGLVDAIWTLTAPEIYDRLVRRCGWSSDQYEEWLAVELAALGAE